MDLRTAIYKPYQKPNSNLTYIQKQSNHPPSMIKDLSKRINKRLYKMLRYSMPSIQRSPKKNRYNLYQQLDTRSHNKNNEKQNKTRKPKITWFNPPFNLNVTTNIAKTFLTLIDEHFPKNNKLSNIFKRNNKSQLQLSI